MPEHSADVPPRFPVRRNSSVSSDSALACIIGSDSENQIAVEKVREDAEVACASQDVLPRVKRILYAH